MRALSGFLILIGLGVTIYMSYVVWMALNLNMWKWGLLTSICILAHISAQIWRNK